MLTYNLVQVGLHQKKN